MNAKPLRRGNWSVQELARLKQLFPRRGVHTTAVLLRRSADSVRKKAQELLRTSPRKGAWTADEDLRLRISWGMLEPRLLGLVLGRPYTEVLRRATTLRAALRTGAWSRQEQALLKEFFGTRSDSDLEICLLRPRAEIAVVAKQLCLAKDKRFAKTLLPHTPARRMPRWTEADAARLRELYPDRDNLDVAQALQRSVASVANKACQLGLKKSQALLVRIGRENVALRYASRRSGADATTEA